jgi:hypothetical protein
MQSHSSEVFENRVVVAVAVVVTLLLLISRNITKNTIYHVTRSYITRHEM